jgi:hypothetical protein
MRLLVALLLLAGCSRENAPNIRYGEDACAQCRMIINDSRFAVAVLENGDWKKFDDIGCWLKSGATGKILVRAYDADAWLDVTQAKFVRGVQSPMGYGIAASAKENGMSFEQLKETK